jgi:folate-binding protein YgfZ
LNESYRALTEHAVVGAMAPRAVLGLGGADRASFLHGLLTNDVQALASGSGCYAAWLTPQGRMITDLHVLAAEDRMLLDVPAELAPDLLQRLDRNVFAEDVQLIDLSRAVVPVGVHGPSAAAILERVLGGATGLAAWPPYHHAPAMFADGAVRVARIDQLGVPGYSVYLDTALESPLRAALEGAGAAAADRGAIEAARIEARYPVFGVDMTNDTIPLEAGIEDRAISFTKGCYVGQEVIVRVLHRGHGRVARRLVGLQLDADVVRGARIVAEGREVGVVTSAARSPARGPIAMGYVHRDVAAAGSRIAVEATGGTVSGVVAGL